jgi:hypothetical protein
LSTIDRHGELVGLVVKSTSELSGRLLGVWKKTFSKDIEVTTFTERMKSSSLHGDLLCLASCKGDKVILGESACQKTKLDTLEGDFGA